MILIAPSEECSSQPLGTPGQALGRAPQPSTATLGKSSHCGLDQLRESRDGHPQGGAGSAPSRPATGRLGVPCSRGLQTAQPDRVSNEANLIQLIKRGQSTQGVMALQGPGVQAGAEGCLGVPWGCRCLAPPQPRCPSPSSCRKRCHAVPRQEVWQAQPRAEKAAANKDPPAPSNPTWQQPSPPCFPAAPQPPGPGKARLTPECRPGTACFGALATGTHPPAPSPASGAAARGVPRGHCGGRVPLSALHRFPGSGGRSREQAAEPIPTMPKCLPEPSQALQGKHPLACSLKPCDSSTATRFGSTLSSTPNAAFP